jgi:hypothetical protein
MVEVFEKGGIELTEVLDSTVNRGTTFTRSRFNYPIKDDFQVSWYFRYLGRCCLTYT